MKIVCLDDHPTMLESLVRELSIIAPESSVCAFQDAQTAFEYAEENGCDVLFCEIDLYGDDGLMFAEKIQTLNPRVNIIFTTVCEEGERAKEVFRIHPSGYITKPYTRQQLAAELKNLRYPVENIKQEQNSGFRTRAPIFREEAEYRPSSDRGENRIHSRSRSAAAFDSQRVYGDESWIRRDDEQRRRLSAQTDAFRKPNHDERYGYQREILSYDQNIHPFQDEERSSSRSYRPEKVHGNPEPSASSLNDEECAGTVKKQNTISDRELRRLSRAELLEILIALMKEKEELQQQLKETEKRLADRTLDIQNAGSIAQAAIKVNGVFEAAQRAADQYLENVSDPSRRFSAVGYEDRECSDRMISETRSRCARMERDTERKCDEMINAAEAEVRARWNELQRKINTYLREHEQLRNLMSVYH